MRRLALTDAELAVTAEAIREALAAELLTPSSRAIARELLDRVDAKLPSATEHHPAGPMAGRLLAGDEILRLLLRCEDRYGHAALTNEAVAGELEWKPAGTSVRELLDGLRRGGWLTCRGTGPERVFALTRRAAAVPARCSTPAPPRPTPKRASANPTSCLTSSTPTAPRARSASATTFHSVSPAFGIGRRCRPPPA